MSRSHSHPPFQVLSKPIGPVCNLDCTYCFYLEKEKLYPERHDWKMAPEVLEAFIRQYIAANEQDHVVFAWQGGEPTLLGVDYFRRIRALQKRYADGKRIENAIQTNGILLDEEWVEFLAEQRFLVGISIDGPARLHDIYRRNKGAQPTHAAVERGVSLLRSSGVAFNTLTTVNRANGDEPLEVYRYLKSIGSEFIQFIPVVERSAPARTQDGLVLIAPSSAEPAGVTDWSVTPTQYGEFLCSIFDEWVCDDVGTRFVQSFEVALQIWAGMPSSLCVFGETCGSALAIEHQGDLYSCDHYVYPEFRLGNIMKQDLATLAHSGQQHAFGQAKKTNLPPECVQCEVLAACNGECPKHRFMLASDGTRRLNYLCAAYKRFFTHADPYLYFMACELAQRRSPASVMKYAQQNPATKMPVLQ
jgi:uncharacterized protein